MITEQLLGTRYRYKEGHIPYGLTQSQKDARILFLDEIHKKNRYIFITKCPYCGNNNFTKISEIDARGLPSDIVICDSCSGCFKLTILDSEANRYHYENISYVLRGKELSDNAIEKLFWNRVRLFAYPRYYFISNFIDLKPNNDLITEFGCNDGANLFPWHKERFIVLGIELDSKMVEFGQGKELNLIYGDLLNYNFVNKKPKLIILSHFLEHVIDVNVVLNRLFEVLQPEGYLFIEVPNIKGQGLGNPLNYFDVEHNYYFDLRSLTGLLKKHSFKILYSDEYTRLLCTPAQNESASGSKTVPRSLDKVKAYLVKMVIDKLDSKDEKLYDLLKKAEASNLKIKILNKLQSLYFKYHYSSIIKAEQKNGSIYS